MRWRIYTVKFPGDTNTPGGDVDIPVEGPVGPGPQVVPGPLGLNGFYVEWRNRPLRVAQKALLPSGSPNPAFAPFLRLGFSLGLVRHEPGLNFGPAPAVLFSRSLVGSVFSTAAGATTLGDNGFADPAGKPTIRLVSFAGALGSQIWRLYLGICEQKDDDRSDSGSV